MKPCDLVMLNMSTLPQWDRGMRNRNYFIAKFWERHPDVRRIIHIDFFPISFRHAVRDVLRSRIQSCPGAIVHQSLLTVVRKRSERVYHISCVASVFRPSALTKEIQKALRAIESENVLLWSYTPLHEELFGQLGEVFSVFDAVDNWAAHQNFRSRAQKIRTNYAQIAKKASVIFTVSDELRTSLFHDQQNAFWVPNGVNLEMFSPEVEKNEELMKLPSPRVGYAGVIEDRFDVELVEYLAQRNPRFSFVIGGMIWDKTIKPRLERFENVHVYEGYIPGDRFPTFLNTFDALMIPHKINDLTSSMQPMKLYEGLALGKPVISTDVAGVRMFDDMVLIAKTKEEFHTMLSNALHADSPEKQRERRERMRNHTWEARGKMMNEILERSIQ